MNIKVGFPRANARLHATSRKSIIVASGRADPGITQVSGTCTSTSGAVDPIAGRVIGFRLMADQAGPGGQIHRWMIAFPFTQTGTYTLSVVGKTATGPVGAPAEVTFDAIVGRDRDFDITWPDMDNEDISAEEDNFVPYGDLVDKPVTSATMTDPNQMLTVSATDIFNDTMDLEFWSAQFPTIGPGTYTLTVTDSGGNHQTRSGLTAD